MVFPSCAARPCNVRVEKGPTALVDMMGQSHVSGDEGVVSALLFILFALVLSTDLG